MTGYRTVTRQRDVTRYRNARRTVSRTVEYFLPVEDFYQTALEQILAEIHASFRAAARDTLRPEDSIPQQQDLAMTPPAGSDDSLSFVSISQGQRANCFVPDALFKVSAPGG